MAKESGPKEASPVHVRLARAGDLPAIVAVCSAAIPSAAEAGELEAASAESGARWFARHDPARYPIWVATREGVIVGWLSLRPWKERGAERGAAEVNVYVAPGAQRGGIGTLLLSHALRNARQCSLRRLIAVVGGCCRRPEPSKAESATSSS
jgi:phosphinothricin acetyltransferase